ncbi:MAG: glycosyltransferase family 39 protein [Robiginitomaculum sp.]|nr:glycosyltransferase family 39 protein [Robiginitomaculum sp.]
MPNTKLRRRFVDMLILAILVMVVAIPGLSGLPVIDRDEARYAQASVQMIETGDYVNISFQDRARNKKPAGAYWAQALSVKAFSKVERRDIWAHRIPSVLGALLAIWACYLGGISMVGRQAALFGAALLATSMMLIFEAHMAKTDALLLGFGTLVLVALGSLRNRGSRGAALLFWGALGCAVMIKGPILPLLVILCFATLFIWERKISWTRPLGFWLGPVLFCAIVLPWTILMWQDTGSAFFTQAIGEDLLPKLQGGHEKHSGVPGYYLLTTWLAFWPACLFLLPGLAFAFRSGRGKNGFDSPIAKAARLLLCWSIPFFILLEITPTKLPHYTLPVFPAFALMSGVTIVALSKVDEFKFSRRIGAVIFIGSSIVLHTALLVAEAYYGDFPRYGLIVLGLAALSSFYAGVKLWGGLTTRAFYGGVMAALLTNIFTYQFTLPNLQSMHISKRVETALRSAGINPAKTNIYSSQYKEPSLVYRLGTHITLGESTDKYTPNLTDIVILDRARDEAKAKEANMLKLMTIQNMCFESLGGVEGFNYAKGRKVSLELLQIRDCAAKTESE